ncbi:MAG TPA: hypothetical protein VH540_08240 [Ktedonobacterales bacterium]|jgi:hypothetical protein
MNRIASVVRMHAKDKNSWFYIPLMVLGVSFSINVLIASLLGGKSPIYTGGLLSIYVYMLVGGVIVVTGSFPFAIGFSVRRKDYFWGTVTMAAVISAIWALLISLLSLVEGSLIPNWGVSLHFFHLPFWGNSSIFVQFALFFVVMLLMFFLGFAPASIYQRFGRSGMYTISGVVIGALSILSLLSTYWNWWSAIFAWLGQQTVVGLTGWMALVAGLCALASYGLLRKATV